MPAAEALASASVLSDAVQWSDRLLMGPTGTSVAVLAVALVGAATLGGRLPVRRGATVIVGCFILFGAGTIAAGLLNSMPIHGGNIPPQAPVAGYVPSIPRAVPYDP